VEPGDFGGQYETGMSSREPRHWGFRPAYVRATQFVIRLTKGGPSIVHTKAPKALKASCAPMRHRAISLPCGDRRVRQSAIT
jgi:hypothetical protein